MKATSTSGSMGASPVACARRPSTGSMVHTHLPTLLRGGHEGMAGCGQQQVVCQCPELVPHLQVWLLVALGGGCFYRAVKPLSWFPQGTLSVPAAVQLEGLLPSPPRQRQSFPFALEIDSAVPGSQGVRCFHSLPPLPLACQLWKSFCLSEMVLLLSVSCASFCLTCSHLWVCCSQLLGLSSSASSSLPVLVVWA